MPNKIYHIVTNARGRKILVVNRLINASQTEEFENEDFDAIFINVVHRTYEETRLVMRWLSPTRVGKCFLKPRFANNTIGESMREIRYLLDGFCNIPTDTTFADFIEDVYRNIEHYQIDRDSAADFTTTASMIANTSRVLANLIKFDISRGRLTYTNYAIKGLASGYSARYLTMYDNRETLQLDERLKFAHKLEELGYAYRHKFIDRVHVCHECGDSHQLFIECCPKCNSSEIRQESMIHHFRCANISPETAYNYDGELICPKCKRALRHIGVDYDRPATVFYCTCGNTFLSSAMKTLCTNCGNVASPDTLAPLDIIEYKFTPAGIKALAGEEAIYRIESTDIYSGRSTFDNFCESVRIFNNLPSYEDDVLFVFRYNFNYTGDSEESIINDVMRTIMTRNTTIKITSQGNDFYVISIAPVAKAETEYLDTKQSIDRFFAEFSEESDQFSAYWLKTYRFSHGDDPEEFIRSFCEKIESNIIEEIQNSDIEHTPEHPIDIAEADDFDNPAAD